MTNDGAIAAQFTRSGLPRRLDGGGLSTLLYPSSDMEDGPLTVLLRRADRSEIFPLIGQRSGGRVRHDESGPTARRRIGGLRSTVRFRAGAIEPAWFWHVRLENLGSQLEVFDLVYLHDVALAPYPAVRTNEFYVSQYLDLTPVPVAGHGTALGVRQNMPGPAQPWALLGCLGEADDWCTDLLQLTGRGLPDGSPWPGLSTRLPAERLQHEHTLAGLQHRSITLRPGETLDTGFFGIVVADHPAATGTDDALYARRALADPAAAAPEEPADDDGEMVTPSLFHRARMVPADNLTGATFVELAGPAAHLEYDENGEPWAAFTAAGTHLVAAAKQRAVLRPHGHLMRSGSSLYPDEDAVTVTAWMAGSFVSQLTQGHVGRVPVLSLRRGYLGPQQAHGVRIFVAEPDSDDWELLGPPSVWEAGPNHCRWRYVTDQRTIDVRSTTPADDHLTRVEVRSTTPVRILAAAHLALFGDDGAEPAVVAREVDPGSGGVGRAVVGVGAGTVTFEWESGRSLTGSTSALTEVGGDEALFGGGLSRDLPWLTFTAAATTQWSLSRGSRSCRHACNCCAGEASR